MRSIGSSLERVKYVNFYVMLLFFVGLTTIALTVSKWHFDTELIISLLFKISFVPSILVLLICSNRVSFLASLSVRLLVCWLLLLYCGNFMIEKHAKKVGKELLNSMKIAEDYVNSIEVFKETHGRYPKSIEELRKSGCIIELPRYTNEDEFYRLEQENFVLILYDPRKIFGELEYSSDTKKWSYLD